MCPLGDKGNCPPFFCCFFFPFMYLFSFFFVSFMLPVRLVLIWVFVQLYILRHTWLLFECNDRAMVIKVLDGGRVLPDSLITWCTLWRLVT